MENQLATRGINFDAAVPPVATYSCGTTLDQLGRPPRRLFRDRFRCTSPVKAAMPDGMVDSSPFADRSSMVKWTSADTAAGMLPPRSRPGSDNALYAKHHHGGFTCKPQSIAAQRPASQGKLQDTYTTAGGPTVSLSSHVTPSVSHREPAAVASDRFAFRSACTSTCSVLFSNGSTGTGTNVAVAVPVKVGTSVGDSTDADEVGGDDVDDSTTGTLVEDSTATSTDSDSDDGGAVAEEVGSTAGADGDASAETAIVTVLDEALASELERVVLLSNEDSCEAKADTDQLSDDDGDSDGDSDGDGRDDAERQVVVLSDGDALGDGKDETTETVGVAAHEGFTGG